jgi:4'-phosphopantetheinyl transferase
MPLKYWFHPDPTTSIGVWKIEEPHSWFMDQLVFSHSENEELADIANDKRRLEWLGSRFLLALMLNTKSGPFCTKDAQGKPHLPFESSEHINITHSHGYTAVIKSNRPCGLDIQLEVTKILKLGHKFIREDERSFFPAWDDLPFHHFIWGAKESMYKAIGQREIDFRKHMNVQMDLFQDGNKPTPGFLVQKNAIHTFDLYWQLRDDYHLVWALEVV